MGAWGYQTFEDDSSLDLLEEWMESPSPIEDMRSAIEECLSQEDFDYDAGQVVATAAAILEFSLSPSAAPDFEEQKEDYPQLSDWLLSLDQVQLLDLLPQVVNGIDRLVSQDSELNELWAENEVMYPQWLEFNNSRKSRLLSIKE